MKAQRTLVALAAAAVLAAGCSGRSESGGSGDSESRGDSGTAQSASGDFGDLSDVCGPGDATAASAQGVTADEIRVGVLSDVGFTKNSEFVDAANVFTEWCNAAGGINGRTLVPETRDAKLMEVRQRMIEACREDFALVGGGAALDGLGVKERLSCLLPSYPAQVSQTQAVGADLEISASPSRVPGYDPYYGFREWLITEKYPESAGSVGIINGDSPVTRDLGQQAVDGITAAGGTLTYNDLYPAMGVADWTPYAQSIKSKNVRGLVFYGDFKQLAKLEEVLTGMDYKLDWIDANNNAYNDSFIELLGKSADFQNNYVDLGGSAPLSSADDAPAVQQVLDMYAQYAPDAEITFPALRAMSAWALFAKAATSCGDDLTRACVYEAALQEGAWTGGGLHAPGDLANPVPPQPCFNVQEATPDGWISPDFGADNGFYRCSTPPFAYPGDYGVPMTLADVGKTMGDIR
ncbi:ABC transporter substrate-binding protein [Rhodococcus coprophilus]|uniref:Lipoprotein n=1 Tax=Rhodococcus coprophilus TaxID=38310 RepID=A0A2X4U8B5_9NOCA|nr:ABC transporter substrate-binding protein [Rhodococcus coprophilus]MBM7459431.1 ABC-type branched-subunit amino acid transport system substrate-binding protein [Rhodococcus coprophilus]SQI36046.1 lipoprotein [Rhodococcus coprophilus]